MKNDFEVIERESHVPDISSDEGTVSTIYEPSRLGDAIVDNFSNILDIAAGILEIEKMKTQSDAVLRQMAESRKNLLAEAEAYAIKKNADTDGFIKKMTIIREMMKDFYQYNTNAKLSGEEFSRVISNIIGETERL